MKKILILGLVALLLTGCSSNGSTGNEETKQIVNIYTRDSASGTREAFEKAIDLDVISNTAIEVASNGDMITKVKSDENAIGYVSLSTDLLNTGLKALNIEGVVPSVDTVLNDTYSMKRPFSYVTRAAGDYKSEELQQLVVAYLDYLNNSIEGALVVSAAGGIVDTSGKVAFSTLKGNHSILNQDNSHLTINTAGSTSVASTLQATLEAFSPMAGNFKFTMNQTGSSDGYKRVLGSEKDGVNQADIGFASRDFSDQEDVTSALNSGIYCIDAVVVIVNENSEVNDITLDTLNAIYAGTQTTLK